MDAGLHFHFEGRGVRQSVGESASRVQGPQGKEPGIKKRCTYCACKKESEEVRSLKRRGPEYQDHGVEPRRCGECQGSNLLGAACQLCEEFLCKLCLERHKCGSGEGADESRDRKRPSSIDQLMDLRRRGEGGDLTHHGRCMSTWTICSLRRRAAVPPFRTAMH